MQGSVWYCSLVLQSTAYNQADFYEASIEDPSGLYQHDTYEKCRLECAMGSSFSVKRNRCEACSQGHYKNWIGNHACVACKSTFFFPVYGAISESTCNPYYETILYFEIADVSKITDGVNVSRFYDAVQETMDVQIYQITGLHVGASISLEIPVQYFVTFSVVSYTAPSFMLSKSKMSLEWLDSILSAAFSRPVRTRNLRFTDLIPGAAESNQHKRKTRNPNKNQHVILSMNTIAIVSVCACVCILLYDAFHSTPHE